ncbi:hypothetical protein BJ165DRAFT_1457454 [Panaeolus papilionaceus]|nr:hypothetical protein BJ165DRAFT_1457454 [Panaeolus papilionaceus]
MLTSTGKNAQRSRRSSPTKTSQEVEPQTSLTSKQTDSEYDPRGDKISKFKRRGRETSSERQRDKRIYRRTS